MAQSQRRERQRTLRRQVIVKAARDLAETEGWEAVTTRRLADRIEFSQPVLYSHFEGKDAIVTAVAVEGFGELADLLHNVRHSVASPDAEPRAVALAYLEFARSNPALYEAMFILNVGLKFGQPDTPSQLRRAFFEFLEALRPLAGSRDIETFTEVIWSGLHGLATLSQAGRLRPDFYNERIATFMDQISAQPR